MPNAPVPNYVAKWLVEDAASHRFIWRGPGSREMNFATVADLGDVVPNDRFYVHNRAMPPSISTSSWTLTISGDAVEAPLVLTYAQLTDPAKLAPVTIRRVLDCGANGRSFFTKYPPAPQTWPLPVGFTEWTYGTMGAADWTGVRLRDVLRAAGLADDATDIMLTGLDQIMVQDATTGKMFAAPYQHVIPIAKALEDDTLLVYEMNGATLPVDHGYPVRAFFSGWGGNTAVKWLGAIQVSKQPIAPPITQINQVLAGPAYPTPVVPTVQNPKSAFELGWGATLMAGAVTLSGRAWSADATITGVEVCIEQLGPNGWTQLGAGWQPATLLATPEPKTWVRFAIPWTAQPGAYRLSARATDDAGNVQPAPEDVPWNQHGLHYNGWVRHPVTVLPMSNMP
jgi:DMSO/TMAO reductase YedYZ molybdopterin-dependent catalytic subunit